MAGGTWKKKDWLFIDEESGLQVYGSKVKRDYWGRQTVDPDPPHPQDFVFAKNDPIPVPHVNYEDVTQTNCFEDFVFTVGNSGVAANRGPATHLFEADGIGDMVIGCTFVVT